MAVYFVFRSQYSTPALNSLKVFPSESVLEWFKEIWTPIPDFEQAKTHAQNILGVHVYGFGSIFRNIAKHNLAVPETAKELESYLRKYLYFEGYLKFEPNVIQVVSNDDELDIAFYIFDDTFLAANGEKADFLLRKEWNLPNQSTEELFEPIVETKRICTRRDDPGALYSAFLSAYDCGDNIMGIEGAWRSDGLRLADLPKYLGTNIPGKDVIPGKEWPFEFFLLRSQLLSGLLPENDQGKRILRALLHNPDVEALWDEFLAFLFESGIGDPSIYLLQRALSECCKFPAGSVNQIRDWNFGNQNVGVPIEVIRSVVGGNWNNDSSKSLLQCDRHLAQASIHTDQSAASGDLDLFNRWIIFDDLWAGANQDLANSILRYAIRWDVLA